MRKLWQEPRDGVRTWLKRPGFILMTVALICALGSSFVPPMTAASRTLSISFVDVEGGAATLIVTPAGESVLLDAGWDGFAERDALRIQQAMQQAGVTVIDHLVASHYHRDPYGGIPELSRPVTVRNFYDHGPLAALAEDPHLPYATPAYQTAAKGHSTILKAGDTIPLKTAAGTPSLKLFVRSRQREVIRGKSPANAECAGTTVPKPTPARTGAASLYD